MALIDKEHIDKDLLSSIQAQHETLLSGSVIRLRDTWNMLHLLQRELDLTSQLCRIQALADELEILTQEAQRKEEIRQNEMKNPANYRYWVFGDDGNMTSVNHEEFIAITGQDPLQNPPTNEDWESEPDPA